MFEVAPIDSSPSKKRKRDSAQSSSVEATGNSAGTSRHKVDLTTPKVSSKFFKPTSSSPVVPSSDADEDEITITGSSNLELNGSLYVEAAFILHILIPAF